MDKIAEDILIALCPIAVMLSVGADLTLDRVREVFVRPKALLVAMLVGYVAVPAAAFGVAQLFSFGPGMTTGFILCAAAPGSPLGVMLAQRAGPVKDLSSEESSPLPRPRSVAASTGHACWNETALERPLEPILAHGSYGALISAAG